VIVPLSHPALQIRLVATSRALSKPIPRCGSRSFASNKLALFGLIDLYSMPIKRDGDGVMNHRERSEKHEKQAREREREREREEGGETERMPLFENNARAAPSDRRVRSVSDPRRFVNVRAGSTVAEFCNFLARTRMRIRIHVECPSQGRVLHRSTRNSIRFSESLDRSVLLGIDRSLLSFRGEISRVSTCHFVVSILTDWKTRKTIINR